MVRAKLQKMRRIFVCGFLLGLACVGLAGPITSVSKYNGKFIWVRLGVMPTATVKTLAKAKIVLVGVTFPQDVKLQKDAGGNTWFSFVLSDIGSDGKWTQAKGGTTLPVSGNILKAGKYTLKLPVEGIPQSVLKDPKQFISVGPNTSGLVGKTSFTVDTVKGQ